MRGELARGGDPGVRCDVAPLSATGEKAEAAAVLDQQSLFPVDRRRDGEAARTGVRDGGCGRPQRAAPERP